MIDEVTIAQWMSPRTAGLRIGINARLVSEYVRQGRIRAIKTDLGYLLDPDSVEEFAIRRAAAPRQGKGFKTQELIGSAR